MPKDSYQLDLFSTSKPTYRIAKPIRLIECFAGIGAQSKALENLHADFQSHRISEWAIPSIKAYAAIHCGWTGEAAEGLSLDEMVKMTDGISANYSEPLTEDQRRKKGAKELATILGAMKAAKDVCPDISKVTGEGLGIEKEGDERKHCYIMTYSFPCITEDSLILTKDGYKPYSELKVGEYVLTKSNTWQRIAKKFYNGIHQTYILNGDIHCTANHKFWVRTMIDGKLGDPEFKEAKDLREGDYMGMPILDDKSAKKLKLKRFAYKTNAPKWLDNRIEAYNYTLSEEIRIRNAVKVVEKDGKRRWEYETDSICEDDCIWYPFRSLVKSTIEPVFNMEVENDHSYIIQGCISKNCQDLSQAGTLAGMSKGSGSRSGLLWQIERILLELKDRGERPDVLVMENVPQVHGTRNIKDWQAWVAALDGMGYSSYYKDLNAKDFGIPQNRNRCFMVSILGDYGFEFPRGVELKYPLKGFLQRKADECYYLPDDLAKGFERYDEDGNPI